MSPLLLNPDLRRWFAKSAVTGSRGRPKVVYHGTTAPTFPHFVPHHNPKEQLGFGIHFAEEASFAEHYASNEYVVRSKKRPGRVIPVLLSVQNPLLADEIVFEGSSEFALARELAGKKLFALQDPRGIRGTYLQAALDQTTPKRAERIVRDHGYDGVRYLSQLGEKSFYGMKKVAEGRSWIVFDSTQVRSALHPAGTGSFAKETWTPAKLDRLTRALWRASSRWSTDAHAWDKITLLVHIGSGDHRNVYALDDRRVVKFAWDKDFRRYNLNEASIWRTADAELRSVLVPVLEVAADGAWLIMERVEEGGYLSKAAAHIANENGIEDWSNGGQNVSVDGRILDYAHGD